MKRKFVSSALAAGTLTLGSWLIATPARALIIDFSGSSRNGRVASSMVFGDPNGIRVTATGESQGLFNPDHLPRNVFQNRNGLGVTFNTLPFEDNRVDGLGLDETLNLAFLQPVNLISATFRSVDKSDEFRLIVDGEQFVDADIPGRRRFNNTFTFTPSPVGQLFGFSVTDWNDDYLLKAIEVTAVPTPAAVLPVLMGMGTAAFRKKRKITDSADPEA